MEEYDLDNYDEDGEGRVSWTKNIITWCDNIIMLVKILKCLYLCLGVVMTGAGMSGLTYFANNEDDPYITLKNPVSTNSKYYII